MDEAFAGFKFAIGDLVRFKGDPHQERPRKYVVVGRCLEEFPGGYARVYHASATADAAAVLLKERSDPGEVFRYRLIEAELEAAG